MLGNICTQYFDIFQIHIEACDCNLFILEVLVYFIVTAKCLLCY